MKLDKTRTSHICRYVYILQYHSYYYINVNIDGSKWEPVYPD